MLLCFMNSSSLQLCFKCRTVFKTLGNMPLDFLCAALTVCSPRMLEIAIRSKWMKMTGSIRGVARQEFVKDHVLGLISGRTQPNGRV